MFVLFNADTGEIEQFVRSSRADSYRQILDQAGANWAEIDLPQMPSPRDFYVDNGVFRPRPVLGVEVSKKVISAGGEDFTVISGLPKPCKLSIDGTEHDVEGGSVELDAALPTTYRLTIDQFPYQPWNTEIVAI